MAALHVDPARSGLADILVEIVDARRRRVDQALAAAAGAADTPSIDSAPEVLTAETNRFLSGLEAQRGRAVIAEVKMGSPSLGSLEGRFDPVAQARTYAAHGAAALSVVVEPDYFFGSYELLRRCVDASGLPAI
ncbi:MAG: indole-3-glycerol-phosphate synthase, partial [Acidobacteriota bacterium]